MWCAFELRESTGEDGGEMVGLASGGHNKTTRHIDRLQVRAAETKTKKRKEE